MNRKDRRHAAKSATTPPTALAGVERLVAQGMQLHQAGRLVEAEALYRRALSIQPREADALHLLGVAAHQGGRGDEAIELIKRAISIDNRVAAYHGNLGEAYRLLGRNKEAISAYRRALTLRPDDVSSRFGFGTALLDERQYAEAATQFEAVLRAEPNDFEARLNLSNALVELGRIDEAIAAYKRVMEMRPDYAEAHFDLGLALRARGESQDAYRAFARAIELAPGMATAHFQIGQVLALLERYDEAVPALQEAIRLRPELFDAYIELGNVLRLHHRAADSIAAYESASAINAQSIEPLNGIGLAHLEQGHLDVARRWFEAALALSPTAVETHVNMALSYQLQGRFDEALVWDEKAIAIEPDHAGARYSMAMIRKFDTADDRMRELEHVLTLESLSDEQRVSLNFALAKAYDDLGDYDAAFRHYAAGNNLKKPAIPYDPASFTSYVDRVIAVFTPELFASKRDFGDPSDLPVFVLGMPRSGTSLTEQILASHPDVHGAGELDYMRRITHQLPDWIGVGEPYPQCIPHLQSDLAAKIAREHVERLRTHSETALRIVDKMPNNFLRVGVIALLFPKARVIHCARDPLDTCLSCYFQEFAHGQPFTYRLDHLGRYYRDYERLMAHWRAVLPNFLLDVPYEALIADQEGWSRKLVDFLGLPWDEQCLAFHKNDRLVRTASFWQVRQPIYTSSVARWRHYEKHLAPLMEALGDTPTKP